MQKCLFKDIQMFRQEQNNGKKLKLKKVASIIGKKDQLM